MRFSVVIPAFNASKTIEQTLRSVFAQSLQPFEILVMDDGSTDKTSSILKSYESRVQAYRQENSGVSVARNTLSQMAKGEIIAFLDSDDLWHPRYLETQAKLIGWNPHAVAYFTGHVNFYGFGEFRWGEEMNWEELEPELIAPVDFFVRYNKAAGPFASPSYCCVPKRVLNSLGPAPFHPSLCGTEDSYLFCRLALRGPVVRVSHELAAYRITESSLSHDRLASLKELMGVFELIADDYKGNAPKELLRAYHRARASKMRSYAKTLMAAGRHNEARKMLFKSITACGNGLSFLKSAGLLAAANFPRAFKNRWNAPKRKIDMDQ